MAPTNDEIWGEMPIHARRYYPLSEGGADPAAYESC